MHTLCLQTRNATIMYKRNDIERIFDFELGHLKASPCKGCGSRQDFPDCVDTCRALDRIQTTLARGIPTTHTHSILEPFIICLDRRLNKA